MKDPVELHSFNHFLLAWWMGQMLTERLYADVLIKNPDTVSDAACACCVLGC